MAHHKRMCICFVMNISPVQEGIKGCSRSFVHCIADAISRFTTITHMTLESGLGLVRVCRDDRYGLPVTTLMAWRFDDFGCVCICEHFQAHLSRRACRPGPIEDQDGAERKAKQNCAGGH